MARPQIYTDEEIIIALKQTRGMVYLAAHNLGCSHVCIYDRSKTSPEVRECMKSERGKFVDVAENKLADAVDAGEAWAVQMALKTLGKDRGYVERQEQQHSGSLGVTVMRLVRPLNAKPLDENGFLERSQNGHAH